MLKREDIGHRPAHSSGPTCTHRDVGDTAVWVAGGLVQRACYADQCCSKWSYEVVEPSNCKPDRAHESTRNQQSLRAGHIGYVA